MTLDQTVQKLTRDGIEFFTNIGENGVQVLTS